MNRNTNLPLQRMSEVDRREILHELLNYDIMTPDVLEIVRTLKKHYKCISIKSHRQKLKMAVGKPT